MPEPMKTERITFTTTPEFKGLIEEMVKQDFVDRSRFIRRLIREEAERRSMDIPEVVEWESR